jgi:hypothetical protein
MERLQVVVQARADPRRVELGERAGRLKAVAPAQQAEGPAVRAERLPRAGRSFRQTLVRRPERIRSHRRRHRRQAMISELTRAETDSAEREERPTRLGDEINYRGRPRSRWVSFGLAFPLKERSR